MHLDGRSIISLIDIATSEENRIAYRSQSPQLIAFAVIGLIYGIKTNWSPTNTISQNTKLELRRIAYGLNIDKIAYETFIASVRRTIKKICELGIGDDSVMRVINSTNEKEALLELLRFLAEKNIFTASHMRIWSLTETFAPLDLTINTGDSAKFRKNMPDKFDVTALKEAAGQVGEIILKIEPADGITSRRFAIAALRKSPQHPDIESIQITEDCSSYSQIDAEINRLQHRLEFIRKEIRKYL